MKHAGGWGLCLSPPCAKLSLDTKTTLSEGHIMAVFQRITAGGNDSIVVLLNSGDIRTVTEEHPGFKDLIDQLNTNPADEAKLLSIMDPAKHIHTRASKVSERFTFIGGTLLFDGDPLEGPLADFIVNIATNSDTPDSYAAWVNFAEKLATNPSEESKEHLFHFIRTHGLTVTPEGDVVLYKGVRSDGTSVHAGPGIVNGQQMNGNLPNEVGSVLEFPRSQVNANRGIACATGLHAGTFDYASSFSQGRLLTVTVNPRDVVSVPSDHSNAKVRVSRYTVVEVNENDKAYDSPVWGVADTDNDWEDEDGEDYDPTDVDSDDTKDDNESEEASDTPIFDNVKSGAGQAGADHFEAKVQEFLAKIPSILQGGWDRSLNYYVSKHVTAANRDAAREAVRRTGLR